MNPNDLFRHISSINIDKPETWANRTFLTFDTDWAEDEVIADAVELCKKANAKVTIFVTHSSPFLEQIQKDDLVEIGLHPNFNPLLFGKGKTNGSDYLSVVESLKNAYPNAISVRSHSLCFGSVVQTAYQQFDITHDVSTLIPHRYNSTPVFPWKMWDGLNRLPYIFCDYVEAMSGNFETVNLKNREGLKIFGFHPIHTYLNTENLKRYENSRQIFREPKKLLQKRFSGFGSRSLLKQILNLTQN